jgi:predicted small lipoprotein YifL
MNAVSESMMTRDTFTPMLRHFRLAAVLVAVLANAGCGIKGPLVLPPAAPPAAAAPAAPSTPASSTPEKPAATTPAPTERRP